MSAPSATTPAPASAPPPPAPTITDLIAASAPEVLLAGLAAADTRSEQLNVLQSCWMSLTGLQVSQDLEEVSKEAEIVMQKLESARSREDQRRVLQLATGERAAIAAVEVAISPVLMDRNVLRVLTSAIKQACVLGRSPGDAARIFDQLHACPARRYRCP